MKTKAETSCNSSETLRQIKRNAQKMKRFRKMNRFDPDSGLIAKKMDDYLNNGGEIVPDKMEIKYL